MTNQYYWRATLKVTVRYQAVPYTKVVGVVFTPESWEVVPKPPEIIGNLIGDVNGWEAEFGQGAEFISAEEIDLKKVELPVRHKA